MSRRTVLTGALSAALVAAAGKLHAEPSRPPPNIVFILADDMGYADVGCYGRPDIQTPNIDHLAAQGVRLLQAYANSAVCSATRTALITGRYQDRIDIGLDEPLNNRDTGLPPSHPTLPSLLRKAGYGTTLVGKWHLGLLPKYGPLQSGYDHFYGFRRGSADYFTHSDDLWEEDVKVHEVGYLTELLGNHAVNVINGYAAAKQPFLLSLHFNAPHWPWEGPEDEAESRRLVGHGLADFDGGSQKTYQRMIEALDLQVGRVQDALRATGLSDNTIVIFTSDNGGERFADTWPFTGRKTELLEGGLRIPAIFSWPARVAPGQTSSQVAISMDWLPTLLAAAGTRPHADFPTDGMNLLPYLIDGGSPVPRELFWRYKANAQHAVRSGDMKYLKILGNTFLFNVVEDPMERANLKDRQPEVFRQLIAQWSAWNATMLPEIDASFTDSFSGAQLADHIGTPAASQRADNPSPED